MSNIKIIEENLNYRLKQIIKKYYGTQKNLSDKLGISRTLQSEWWAGRSKPRSETLQAICEDTGVSMDWLVLGRAEPYINDALFKEIFDKSLLFAKENNIEFSAMYLLGMQRIIINEIKHSEQNISIDEIFIKYTNIIKTIHS